MHSRSVAPPTHRPDGQTPPGLTTTEADRRRARGLGNRVEQRTTRTLTDIIRANTVTRFNAIVASLTVVVLVFGDPIDAVFGLVMVLNSCIGIVQEIRAKRSLDAVQVLLVPSIAVRRDGVDVRLEPDDLVLGDVIGLEPGDQVPVDGRVVTSVGLEVDESALTGESDPVEKPVGAEIRSGSVVVAGTATAEATAVGEDAWAHKLTSEAKDYALTSSELRVGIDRLLTVISWLLPPLSALLLWSQLRLDGDFADGMVGAVAGVVSLVPQGLVLLVSMTFAIAVIRLAKREVVVQELPAVEGLARVDVLCVDKTGTLTTGRLTVDRIEAVGRSVEADERLLREGLGALARLETARSGTMDALDTEVGELGADWEARRVVPFSSVRKWSGATYPGRGTWILGAPEILLDAIDDDNEPGSTATARRTVDGLTAEARRVLLVAVSDRALADDERLPTGMAPFGIVALREEVRPDAAETMAYFHDQDVTVKVISGDNPRTVAAVASEVGIPGADRHVDLRSTAELADLPADTTVFGRVLPEQKRDLVRLLQERGHTVAMTGDGVNDIPSLKAADIGIAMNTATPATKAVAQLVLLDGRFDRLPSVVAEGRRVIANMERVSSLFVTKTVYAAALAVLVGVVGVAFPFLPRHLSLVGAMTIGIPGFVLSFAPSSERCRPGYLQRVLRFAVPAGLVATVATFAVYWVARSPVGGADLTEARTAATMTMTLTGLWILYRLVRPLDRLEAGLLIVLLAALALLLIPSPVAEFYALRLPPPRTTGIMLASLAATMAVLQLALELRPNHRGKAS